MPAIYNFQEVYAIGLQIEQNGLAFYRHFALNSQDASSKLILSALADWEVQHAELFEKLRKEHTTQSPDIEAVDKSSEGAAYLRALADSHVFLKSFDLDDLSRTLITPKQVLSKALQFEKDSVILYQALALAVPEDLGRNAVVKLAEEEMQHVEIILKELAKL